MGCLPRCVTQKRVSTALCLSCITASLGATENYLRQKRGPSCRGLINEMRHEEQHGGEVHVSALPGVSHLAGALPCTPRSWGFHSRSGHIPRLGVRFPVGPCMGGNQLMFFSHINVSPSPSLPPKINKVFKEFINSTVNSSKAEQLMEV